MSSRSSSSISEEEVKGLIQKQSEQYRQLTELLGERWGDAGLQAEEEDEDELPSSEILAHELASTVDALNEERERRAKSESYARNLELQLEDRTNALVAENSRLSDRNQELTELLRQASSSAKEDDLLEKCRILERGLSLSEELSIERNREIDELKARLRDSVYIGDLSTSDRARVRQVFANFNETTSAAETKEEAILQQSNATKTRRRGPQSAKKKKRTSRPARQLVTVHDNEDCGNNDASYSYRHDSDLPSSASAGGTGLYLLNGYASAKRHNLPTFVPDSF